MRNSRLFTITTAVAQMFFMGLVSASIPAPANAQTSLSVGGICSSDKLSDSQREACLKSQLEKEAAETSAIADRRAQQEEERNRRNYQYCEDAYKEYKTDHKKFMAACGGKSCVSKIKSCNDGDTNTAMSSMSGGNACLTLMANASCPEKNAEASKDYQQEKKDLEQSKKDLTKEVEEITKEGVQLQKSAKKSQQELEKTMGQVSKGLENTEKNINREMQKLISQVRGKKLESLQKARVQLQALDKNYHQILAQQRASVSAITNAKIQHVSQCKAEAEQKYRESNAEIKQNLTKDENTKKNYVTASKMAGAKNKTAKKAESQRSANYAAFYKDCINGVSTKGAELTAQIQALTKKLEDDEFNLKNAEKELVTQREEIVRQLMENDTEYTTQLQENAKLAAEDINDARKNYESSIKESQNSFISAQEEIATEVADQQNRLLRKNQELNQMNMNISAKESELQCANMSGGKMSSSVAQKKLSKYDEASDAMGGVSTACGQLLTPACKTYFKNRGADRTAASAPATGNTSSTQTSTSSTSKSAAASEYTAIERSCSNYSDMLEKLNGDGDEDEAYE